MQKSLLFKYSGLSLRSFTKLYLEGWLQYTTAVQIALKRANNLFIETSPKAYYMSCINKLFSNSKSVKIYRNKRFPKKPKSEKVSLISTAAFGGWLIIREYVLDLFGPCKDPQYVMLVNLLDEISCFNFFFYTAFFRGGNFETWLHALLRGSMMFINFRRRNYDKATLCQLSDILFHVSNNVGLGERIQQFLQVFTEKKVEILHSVLRR